MTEVTQKRASVGVGTQIGAVVVALLMYVIGGILINAIALIPLVALRLADYPIT